MVAHHRAGGHQGAVGVARAKDKRPGPEALSELGVTFIRHLFLIDEVTERQGLAAIATNTPSCTFRPAPSALASIPPRPKGSTKQPLFALADER